MITGAARTTLRFFTDGERLRDSFLHAVIEQAHQQLMPSEEYSFLTSTIVKEAASFGGSVEGLVPPFVERALKNKFGPSRKKAKG